MFALAGAIKYKIIKIAKCTQECRKNRLRKKQKWNVLNYTPVYVSIISSSEIINIESLECSRYSMPLFGALIFFHIQNSNSDFENQRKL